MSKVTHTPGPWAKTGKANWSVDTGGDNTYMFVGPEEGDPVAVVVVADAWTRDDELEANAALIAAAPELLEALKGMVAWYATRAVENDEPLSPEYQDAEIAEAMRVIARAEGRQP